MLKALATIAEKTLQPQIKLTMRAAEISELDQKITDNQKCDDDGGIDMVLKFNEDFNR